MLRLSKAECVVRRNDGLGEVPLWCAATEKLWWVDVKAPAIQSYHPASGAFVRHPLPGRTVGSWAFRKQGGMALAMQDGLYSFSPGSTKCERLAPIEASEEGHRLNDGRCDRRGRFWVGSMHETLRDRPRGALYRVEEDLSVAKVMESITVPNSLVFSPDDRLMYFADTPQQTIWAFDFDAEAGRISNQRVFVDTSGHPGLPDGSAVDVDGCVWNAEYRGGRVVRYTPSGKIDCVIELGVTQPTSCTFGGKDLDVLFITSAAQRLSPEEIVRQPEAGSLFAVRVGTQGLPEPAFAG